MKLEYINPFVEAAYETLSQYINDGSLKSGDVALRKDISSMSGIAVILTLVDSVAGNIVIDLDKQTADNIVGLMNEGHDVSEDVYYSTLKELVNLIGGLYVTKLYKLGFNLGVTPPMIIKGNDVDFVISESEALHVELSSSIGILNVLVSIAFYNE